MTTTSVIMPVRNGAAFILEGIGSALTQLDADDEIIVIDDASTDATREVVNAISDTRIRLLDGLGCGVSAARNIGLAAARGEFIAFLDHDDLWPDHCHAIMRSELSSRLDLDAVYGRIRIRFEAGTLPLSSYVAIDGTFAGNSSICNGLFRRSLLDRVGGFAEEMRYGEDTDYYLRLREAGMRAGYCEVDCLIYRRHDNNSTNDRSAALDGMSDILRRRILRRRAQKSAETH